MPEFIFDNKVTPNFIRAQQLFYILSWSDRVGSEQTRTERQTKNMVAVADKLVDEIAGHERNPMYGLLEIVATRIEQVENKSSLIEDTEPRAVLNCLMVQHDLKQTDRRPRSDRKALALKF